MSRKIVLPIKNSSEKSMEGYAQILHGKLWVHYQGQTFVSDLQKGKDRKRSHEGKATHHHISAPMPGKVTKIDVQVGQDLESGTAVVVMEAMKMEYTLKCEAQVSVEEILVQVGDQVLVGQLLVKLKPTLVDG